MNCKIPWSMDFIWDQFTHVFYNTELEEHRSEILFEREKVKLPETQHRLYCEKLRSELAPLEDLVFLYENEATKPDYYPHVKQRIQEIIDIIGPTRTTMKEATKKVIGVLRGCPKPECKGFIMKQKFQCGLCYTKICSKCHVILTDGEQHTCTQEDIETAKILTTNTKPCPKCREMIYKVDGCDQMWCTMCHTAFSWNTGEIENHVHNPHYYEWMRRSGQTIPRAEGDVPFNPCANERPDFRRINVVHTETPEAKAFLMAIHRLVGHIQYHEIPGMNRVIQQGVGDNTYEHLRIEYLRNDITEEEWKRKLILNLKKAEKWTVVREIMELFTRVAIEHLNAIAAAGVMDRQQYTSFIQTMSGIRTYCNQAFASIRIKYNMVPYYISETWGMERRNVTTNN
jgi:hypothetical protein